MEWSHGGEATVLAVSADAIRLRSTVPSPPGSRISGTLQEESAGVPGAALRVKIHACKKQPDGTFLLEGRPLDLTRELRALLEKLTSTRRT